MDSQNSPNTGVELGKDPVVTTGPITDTAFVSQYASDAQMYPLESLEGPTTQAAVISEPSHVKKHLLSFSKRQAMIVSLLITAGVMFLTGLSVVSVLRHSPDKKQDALGKVAQQDVLLNGVDKSQVPKELQGASDSLLVNGDVITNGDIKVSHNGVVTTLKVQDTTSNQTFTLPASSGVICLDSNNCGYATSDALAALQSQLDSFSQVTIPPAGVSELNGQKDSVSIQGSLNQVSVTTSNGVIKLSTPQSLDANANVQFGNLSVGTGGTIKANNISQTAAGNNVNINAGNNMVTFVAGGRVFQLPTTGPASQTICTTGATCASGSGSSVLLAPTTAQSDTTADASIFINDTGGGHLIELQSGGVDKLTVANNGDTTVGGSLTVSSLGSGFVKSTGGTLSVVGSIDLSTDVTGTLAVNKGGTGSTTAAGARTNLGAAASGANADITSTTALNTITPSGALTVGSTGQSFTLQGSGSSTISVGSGGNTTSISFAAPSGNNTLTVPALSGTICVSGGNCVASGAAGGDLTGSYPNPTIAKLQGTTLNISSAAAGHVLIYNGTNGRWENHSITGDVTISETGSITIANSAVTNSKIANGAVDSNKIADGSVTGTDIGNSTITGGNIANATVTGTNIAANTVANGNLVNSSLTVTAGNGLSGGGAVSLGASTSLAVVYGSAANTAVQGNTAITITAGNGLTGGGNITLGAGGSSTLNVAYGSSANTAVQGNTQLTCASGTGNLSGGGNVITLGTGGTCGSLTITNSPVFSGTLAVQGATATIGANGQQGSVVLYNGGSGASAHTGTVQVLGGLAQDTTYVLPDPAGASATICLSTGNCAGSGGGVTSPGGTNGKIAKFTGSNTVADSTLSESGSTVTATGNVVIQGGNSLTLGTSSSFDGSIAFRDAAGTHTVTLQAPVSDPSSDLTFKLPNADGASGDCLKTDSTGNLSFGSCLSGSGSNGGVASINSQSGIVNIANATAGSGTITINDATTAAKGIASFSSTNFAVTTGAVSIKAGGVGSTEIADGSVTGSDIGSTTITGGNIANATVTNSNLVNSGLTVTAGSNLSGGGLVSLGGTTTLNVVSNPTFSGLVTVNAGLTFGAGQTLTINSDAFTDLTGDGLQVTSGALAVDGTVCRTTGNCAGAGGGLIGSGTSGQVAYFNGSNTLTSSANFLFNGSDLTASGIVSGNTLTSTVANGTAPLTVTSSTLVSNFNADLLDGQHGSYYQNASNINAGTLAVNRGGTGLNTLAGNGQLLIGNGTGYSLATLSNNDGTVDIINGPGSIVLSVPRADQCATCADYTLSNLADVVAINKSLLPASAGAIDLGGSSVPYGKLYLSGTSSTPASNNFTITGNASTSRTLNLPDADGTFCLLQTCLQLQPTSPGTAQTGNINLNGLITASNLNLSGTATVNALTPSAGNGLVLGATGASQTTNLQGNGITFTNGSASYTFNSSAAGSQTICDTSGNCAGTGGGVIASGGSAYNLPVFTSSNTLANSIIGQDAGATTATVSGILKVTGSSFAGTGALTVSSTGAGNALNLSSASGTLGLTGTTNIIQRVGNSLTLDVNSGAASTLTITNSNGSNVANLSVEGGVNIGSGQAYKINNADINTAGTLNNVAYLNQNNSFTGAGNTSFAGTLTGGTYNGQTISNAASFTGTVSVAGANALTLGQASTNSGAIVFQNNAGSNTVKLKAADVNPTSSFTLTLPSALGSSGDCLQQIDGTGTLGFVGCAAGLGGGGTTGTIALFSGTSAIGDSLLTQSGSTVAIQGASNGFQVDGSITVGKNGASGNTGTVVFNDGSNPGRAVSVQAQQAGSSYTLLLPTTADVGSTCLTLSNVSAGVAKIGGGSCAAGGSGGNITATGTTNGHLLRATSDGPSYSAAASLIQDDGTGVSLNVAPQSGYLLAVGSANKFKVTDGGQLEIGTTGSNPLTLAPSGAISNVTTLTASGLLQSTANGQALSLSGAPTNSATQSLLRLGNAIVGGNSAANGGTYLGINAPSSGAGSVADFVNFQANGTTKLKVDKDGNLTGGTYNGVTIGGTGAITSGGYTLTLTGNSTLNQNLTTSSTVQFGSLTLGSALAPAYGGTGSDTSGALAGSTLIFNATTGKFEANKITSSDSSLTVVSTDGSIDLKVASCATCASNDLSNLAATTNLNSTLRAQANVDLGATSTPFRDLYLSGSSASRSSNNFKITGTATSARTITLPDASGTVCLTNNCVTLQGSGHSPQSGYVDISNDITVGGNAYVSGTATINTLTPAASTPLLIGGTGASQTTTLQGNGLTLTDAGHSYTFSKSGSGTHTICDDTGNCAGAGGGALVSGGSAFYMPVFNNANTLINSIISQDAGAGATTATVAGKLAVTATNNSGSSLVVSNSSLTANNSNLAQFTVTNANSGASSTTVNGLAVNVAGTTNGNSNANTINGLRLNDVSTLPNNTFNAISVGSGYNDILKYNNTSLINGSGYVQNAAIDQAQTYSNLKKVGTLDTGSITTGFGSISISNTISGTQLMSTVASGTAPLTVSSTTLVANLNVDKLDGQDGSFYQDAGNINAGTLSVARGGTGLGSLTQYGVLFGNGTSAAGVTAAGTNGQCLLANTGGAPTWGTCTATNLQGTYDASSSPATIDLADGKDLVINAKDRTTTDPSILFSLQCNASCSSATAGRFAIQATSQSGHDVFTVKPNGDIVIGDTTAGNYVTFSAASGYQSTATGNAKRSKTLVLPAEYVGAALDAASDASCSSANSGTLTSGFTTSGTSTNNKPANFYNWTSTQGSAQCYDVVVQIPVPSDFSAWNGNQTIDTWSNDTTNGTLNLDIKDTAGVRDGASDFTRSLTPGSNSSWAAKTFTFTGGNTYTPGGTMTLRIRMSAASSKQVQVGTITLNYLSSY